MTYTANTDSIYEAWTFMFRQINVEFFVENYTLGEITKTPEELLRDD